MPTHTKEKYFRVVYDYENYFKENGDENDKAGRNEDVKDKDYKEFWDWKAKCEKDYKEYSDEDDETDARLSLTADRRPVFECKSLTPAFVDKV